MGWWIAWFVACGGENRPAPVATDVARSYALGVDVPFAELEIPDGNRPGGAEPAERIPLDGPWRSIGPNKGMSRYQADLPVRPRGLFFHSAQAGMEVLDATGQPVPYARGVGRARPFWNHERDTVLVALPGERRPPKPGEFTLRWPKASERERTLNFAMAGIPEKADFVRTTVQVGWDSRMGVLVPAPGVVAWDLVLPPAAELHFAPGIVPPELR
ncbi:MAG: hypothetical protein H0V89_08465, partial [Deltaproteobacteria bacterium]|nr:hypothetical protein [Deltaproteobacteria bacterium]